MILGSVEKIYQDKKDVLIPLKIFLRCIYYYCIILLLFFLSTAPLKYTYY